MERLRRLWRNYLKRYTRLYALGVVFLVATNALTVAIPGFVERAVDALSDDPERGRATLWAWAILAAGLGILVVRTLSRVLIFNPGRTVEYRFKSNILDHLLTLPRAFFDRVRPGEILSRGTNDMNAVRAFIGFAGLQVVNVVLMFGFTLARMTAVDPLLTVLCAVPIALAGVGLRQAVQAMFRYIQAGQEQIATLSERILESYNGAAEVQAYNALPGLQARFDEDNQELLRLQTRLVGIQVWLLPIVSIVGSLCVAILLTVGGYMVVEQERLTVGQIAAFSVYIQILVTSLTGVGFMLNAMQRGWAALGRVFELLDTSATRPEVRSELPEPGPSGYGVEITDLTYRHAGTPSRREQRALPLRVDAGVAEEGDGARPPSLAHVSCRVRPGETIGVFGETGSGKTTLLDLLARVYEPPPQSVWLQGHDVRELPVRDYWRRIAYVPQEPFLFTRTVRDNVALSAPVPGEAGEEQATASDLRYAADPLVDEARLRRAVADACLDDDLAQLPEGLDTLVGERGVTLSGGQRQRVALARAFYRDFDLLLLDDVLSAVDHATERKLIDAIYRRTRGKQPRTSVVVSHRVSVLARADRVLVLERGQLVDQGTHDELVRRPGPYARAWELQRAAEAWAARRAAAREVVDG